MPTGSTQGYDHSLEDIEEVTHLLCMDNAMLGQALPFLTFIERTVKSTMEAAEQDTPAFDLASGLLSELNCSQHFISVKEDVMFFSCYSAGPSLHGHSFD